MLEYIKLIPFKADDYCKNEITTLSEEKLSEPVSGFESSYTPHWITHDIVKNVEFKISNETGCRIDSMENSDNVQESFKINIFMVKDDKSYNIVFTTRPIDVPKMMPIAERIIQSFRFL